MKNIHVLPTDKPSRLSFDFDIKQYYLQEEPSFFIHQDLVENRNIYITSDEEIKEGDWCLDSSETIVVKCLRTGSDSYWNKNCKKIILTTDSDLVDDGVQAIDDEFLEWFVEKANDSGKPIDIVEVEKEENLWYCCDFFKEGEEKYCINSMPRCPKCNSALGGNPDFTKYKIIIPKEEAKPFKDMQQLTKVDWEKFKKKPFPSVKEESKKQKVIIMGDGNSSLGKALSDSLRGFSDHKGGIKQGEINLPIYKKELKQETLEEAIQKVSNSDEFNNGALFAYQWIKEKNEETLIENWREGVKFGSDWEKAKEQDINKYSEEEAFNMLMDFWMEKRPCFKTNPQCVANWFEKFKKK